MYVCVWGVGVRMHYIFDLNCGLSNYIPTLFLKV